MARLGLVARLAVASMIVLGCSTEDGGHRPRGSVPGSEGFGVTAEIELAVGQIQGLVSWHEDVLVICPYAERMGDRENCEVHRLDAKGATSRVGISGVRSARRVKGGILVQRSNLELAVVHDDESETKLDDHAWMPAVAVEGDRIAYVRKLLTGVEVVFSSIDGKNKRVVSTDETAYGPAVVPGSDDVLFVSARTGVASYFLGKADGSEKQLTNVGMTTKQKGFVPVALEQLLWLPKTKSVVFTAHYGVNELWKLDVETGQAERLGPGEYPNLESKKGGAVIAFDRGPAYVERAPRVARYLEQAQ